MKRLGKYYISYDLCYVRHYSSYGAHYEHRYMLFGVSRDLYFLEYNCEVNICHLWINHFRTDVVCVCVCVRAFKCNVHLIQCFPVSEIALLSGKFLSFARLYF